MIETDRLYIRKFTLEDAEDIFEVLFDKKVMEYIEDTFSKEQTISFIKKVGLCDPPSILAIQLKSGKVIGHVIFHRYNSMDTFEIGWIINRQYWHQGIASEITKALIHEARKNRISRLIIECDSRQEVTKYIAVKYGFIFIGIENNLEVFELLL